jgi:hypothetical protein
VNVVFYLTVILKYWSWACELWYRNRYWLGGYITSQAVQHWILGLLLNKQLLKLFWGNRLCLIKALSWHFCLDWLRKTAKHVRYVSSFQDEILTQHIQNIFQMGNACHSTKVIAEVQVSISWISWWVGRNTELSIGRERRSGFIVVVFISIYYEGIRGANVWA